MIWNGVAMEFARNCYFTRFPRSTQTRSFREFRLMSCGGLQRLPRRADKIAQNSNVWAVSADAPGVHRQTEAHRRLRPKRYCSARFYPLFAAAAVNLRKTLIEIL